MLLSLFHRATEIDLMLLISVNCLNSLEVIKKVSSFASIVVSMGGGGGECTALTQKFLEV